MTKVIVPNAASKVIDDISIPLFYISKTSFKSEVENRLSGGFT
jgi:hypothetical protein